MIGPGRQRGGVLKVLLIVFGVIALLMVCAGIYVATHWKGWAASAANNAALELVNDSGLPPDQKHAILQEVQRLGDDFKSGAVSTAEIGLIVKAMRDGPLLPLAGVQAARDKYIDPSDMTPEEKASAILTLQRFARGVHEKSIRTDEIDDVVKPIADRRENGNWNFKSHPTRMELDQFIANAKERADEAKIPNEPFDVNIAEELRKVIHQGETYQ